MRISDWSSDVCSSDLLDAWQAAEYGPIPRGSDVLVNVWVRDGDDLIHADAVAGRGRATRLRGVTIYERSGGRLDSILSAQTAAPVGQGWRLDKRSEEHTSELQSLMRISYAVFCLKKKKIKSK